MDSPVGTLEIIVGSGGVERITKRVSHVQLDVTSDSNRHLYTCQQALKNYFSSTTDRPPCTLNPMGTQFQREVWTALLAVPYGETRSYQDMARMIGRPKAVRAVANAIGKNPILILIPCHRVVRKNGEIGGFSGGTELKQMLLNHERTMNRAQLTTA